MTDKLKFTDAKTLLDNVLDLRYFHPNTDGDTAIPFHRVEGKPKSKLILVVGENASGKSFFRRLVKALCASNKKECIDISVEARTSGFTPGFVRACVYGNERRNSTGTLASGTVLNGIKTCQGRDNDHVIVWDEPDLGLSPSWSAGMGQTICDFAQVTPKKTKAIIVITHSRDLVQQLIPAHPTFLHLGAPPNEAPLTIKDWLLQKAEPRNLDELAQLSRKRQGMIQKAMDASK